MGRFLWSEWISSFLFLSKSSLWVIYLISLNFVVSSFRDFIYVSYELYNTKISVIAQKGVRYKINHWFILVISLIWHQLYVTLIYIRILDTNILFNGIYHTVVASWNEFNISKFCNSVIDPLTFCFHSNLWMEYYLILLIFDIIHFWSVFYMFSLMKSLILFFLVNLEYILVCSVWVAIFPLFIRRFQFTMKRK